MRWLAFLFLLGGCQHTPPAAPPASPPVSRDEAMRARCCAQCSQASARDPTGADISGKTCTSYPAQWNGGPGIDDPCRAWFVAQSQPPLVGDCWAAARTDGGSR